MKKIAKRIDKQDEPVDDPPPSAVSFGEEKKIISIENFNRESKHVFFTESFTIEAMRQLGYNSNDFSYRSFIDFRRPGCDDSVTTLLFQKHESKRRRIIEEVEILREKLIKENDELKTDDEKKKKLIIVENSPMMRIEKAFIEKEKKNLINVQQQRENDLKKIVVSQFRDFFQHQMHEESLKRTLEKTEQISQMKMQMLNTAKLRAAQPPTESPQNPYQNNNSDLLNSINSDVDVHLERVRLKNDEIKKQREEIKQKNELHIKVTHDRSIELVEKQKEEKLKRIADNESRFQKWKENHSQILVKRSEKFKDRISYEKNVFNNGIKIEEDMKTRKLMKINDSEIRSRNQSENTRNNINSKIDLIRNRINDRSSKAQEELQRQKAELEKIRKKLDERDQEIEEKRKKMNLNTTLKYLARKIDRDDKADNAKRLAIRQQYMAELMNKRRHEDTVMVHQLNIEKQKIINDRSSADSKFQSRKEQLMAEFHCAADPNDPKTKKKIATLLRISPEEMDELVQMAKTTLGEFSRPRTALANTGRSSSISSRYSPRKLEAEKNE